jgi:hypothetical protein
MHFYILPFDIFSWITRLVAVRCRQKAGWSDCLLLCQFITVLGWFFLDYIVQLGKSRVRRLGDAFQVSGPFGSSSTNQKLLLLLFEIPAGFINVQLEASWSLSGLGSSTGIIAASLPIRNDETAVRDAARRR